MKQTWRLIYTGSNDGFHNMAVDEAIAIAVRERRVPYTLRFYTWAPPCISIGYFQTPEKTLNGSIVRRITGGRAVHHGNDLSYSVVSLTDNTLFPKTINGTYSTIANAFSAGLRHMGLSPDPVGGEKITRETAGEYRRKPLCFNTSLRHEIKFHGKKLIGSAQRRWSDVFLQHGSILVSASMRENGPSSISLEELSEISGKTLFNLNVDCLIASLSHGFSETLDIQFCPDVLSDYELSLSAELITEKYSRL